MDIIKVHMKSIAGIDIESSPIPPITPYSDCEESQASRRRNKILWKRDCEIALKNKILFWVLFIPICVIEFAGILVLGGMLSLDLVPYNSVLVGIFIAMVIIFAWLATYSYLDDRFETDPNYLK